MGPGRECPHLAADDPGVVRPPDQRDPDQGVQQARPEGGDDRDRDELFDLRLCMEVGAARFAARQVGLGRSAQPLRDVLERSREGVRTRDAYRIAADSTEFHEVVVDLTANTLMRSVMRSVTGRMMWLFYLTSDLDADDALDGHEELLSAIESGKERVAEAIAYAHIERDRDESMRVLVERRGIATLV
jgi:DNA-binding GntR family transcriptional regulator